MNYILNLKLLVFVLMVSSCAIKSTFRLEEDSNYSKAVEFCDGKQWGYVDKIKNEKDNKNFIMSAIIMESLITKNENNVVFNFLIETKSNLDITFKDKVLNLKKENLFLNEKPSPFYITEVEKNIYDRYSTNDYNIGLVDPINNIYKLEKKILGISFFTEKPFYVQIKSHPAELIDSFNYQHTFNADLIEATYLHSQILISLKDLAPNSRIVFTTPEYVFNGQLVKPKEYVFNFDFEKLTRIKTRLRCVSFQDFIRHSPANIGQNPLQMIFTPRLTN